MTWELKLGGCIEGMRGHLGRFEKFYLPEPNTGCWLWFGSDDGHGRYGRFSMLGRQIKAHRASWMIFRGPLADHLCVLHECDIPWCVNPDHLFLGTQLENAQDRERKDRGNHARGERHFSRTKPWALARGDSNGSRTMPERLKRGEDNARAVLTANLVLALRAEYAAGGVTYRALAQRHRMAKSSMMAALKGLTWRHLVLGETS